MTRVVALRKEYVENQCVDSEAVPAERMDINQFANLYSMIAYVAHKHDLFVEEVTGLVAKAFSVERVEHLAAKQHKDVIYFLANAFVEPPMFQAREA